MLEVKQPVKWGTPLQDKVKEILGEQFVVKQPKQIDVMVEVYAPDGHKMMVSHRKLKIATELGLSLRA